MVKGFYTFVLGAFNRKDSKVYGIIQNTISLDQRWGVFNPVSNVLDTSLLLVPHAGNGIGCKSILNPLNQRYIIQSSWLASVNVNNGHTVTNVPIQNQIDQTLDHIAFSCKDQMVYGLSSNPHTNETFFATVDTSSGLVALVNSAPLQVSYYMQYLSGSAIDNDSDIFYYPAAGGYVYGIDIHTGQIVYSHYFGANVEFLFLESASTFHCIAEDVNYTSKESNFEVYPNPATTTLHVNLRNTNIKTVQLYNYLGEKIQTIVLVDGQGILDIVNVKSGVYILKADGYNYNCYSKVVIK
jgi:hypothetical protein